MNKKIDNRIVFYFWRALISIAAVGCVVIAFFIYSNMNRERIKNQNTKYALDAAQQTAGHIDTELSSAIGKIQTYAFYLGQSLTDPNVTAGMLTDLENEETQFDNIRYTDDKGVNIASDGRLSDATDRDYYMRGMQGNSGISVILDSRITGEPMIGFYTPVEYEGNIIGVLRGVYTAKRYLSDMLTADFFGVKANAYLCLQSGEIVASSDEAGPTGDIVTYLIESGYISKNQEKEARLSLTYGGATTIECKDNTVADTLAVVSLKNGGFVLIQTFPHSVADWMLRESNKTGLYLEIIIIASAFVYILAIIIQARRYRKRLENENRDLAYMTIGTRGIVNWFVLVDLEKESYRYIGYNARDARQKYESGEYISFVRGLLASMADPGEEAKMNFMLSNNNVKRRFADPAVDRFEETYRVLEGDNEIWYNLTVMCAERDENTVKKILLMRQDITAIKMADIKKQQALVKAQLSVDRSKRDKNVFLHNISAMISERAQEILDSREMVMGPDAPMKMPAFMGIVSKNASQLANSAVHIRLMADIEAGHVRLEQSEYDLNALVAECRQRISEQLAQKMLKFDIELGENIPKVMFGDRVKIADIIENMLRTAIGRTNQGYVHFKIIGQYVDLDNIIMRFEIRDSSKTLTMEELSRIQGKNLNMSVAKMLIELMDGNLETYNDKEGENGFCAVIPQRVIMQ